MNRFFLTLLFLLSLYPAWLKSEPLHVKRLGIAENLSNTFVMGITQDEEGFIWMATRSGLNKFDGKSFKSYKKRIDAENSLGGNEINKILHHDHAIWIATQRSGLDKFDCRTMEFTHFVHDVDNPASISDDDVVGLALSEEGNIWAATYNGGVNLYDRASGTFTRFSKSNVANFVNDRTLSIADDHAGKLYVGHETHGFSIIDVAQRTAQNFMHIAGDPHSLASNKVNAIQIDQNGYVWLGTNDGLSMFNPDDQTFINYQHEVSNPNSLLSNVVNTLYITENNRLCVGTTFGGISVLDLKRVGFTTAAGKSFENFRPSADGEGLSSPDVMAIFQDTYQNIWVGTYGGGANFIDNRQRYFNRWSYSSVPGGDNRLSSPIAQALCVDQEDRVWVSTMNSGIDVFSQGKKVEQIATLEDDLLHSTFFASFTDSQGNLWFGGYHGTLYVKLKESGQFKKIAFDKMIKQNIRVIYEDRDGLIYLGTTEGLFYYDYAVNPDSAFHAQSNALQEIHIRTLVQDRAQNLWMGTAAEGVCIYDRHENRIRSLDKSNYLYSNIINHLFVAADSTIWVATNEGLAHLSGPDFSEVRIYTERDGLPDNAIKAISQDRLGNIWFSSNVGISKLDQQTHQLYNYNHLDGVPAGNFIAATVAQSRGGMLYFGSQNGVCYFNPSLKTESARLSRVAITEFIVLDRQSFTQEKPVEQAVESKIRLTHEQNTFKISFNELNYALSDQVEFAYRLIGLDDSWYDLHDERSVIFRNLNPGEYRFEVKSRVRNGRWEEATISLLDIRISPPFWFAWWAKMLYFLLIGVLIALLIHTYKQRLKRNNQLYLEKENLKKEQELNREKMSFYTNVTHELRTPLTLILGPLEDLVTDPTLPEKFASRIKMVAQNAARLSGLVNQILEFRKIDANKKRLSVYKENISPLLIEIASKYRHYIEKKGIKFTIEAEEEVVLYYDTEVITTIVNNLLSNAIKYTQEGEIGYRFHVVEEDHIAYLKIEVADTGIGIPQEKLPRIFERYYQAHEHHTSSGTGIGLALVQSLSQLHDARITIETAPGTGSTFALWLKMEQRYPEAIHHEVSPNPCEATKREEDAEENKNLILVIEDNAEILEYISDFLGENYRVKTATDGIEGVNAAFDLVPDIIISDIMMPHKDGIELCQELKNDIRTSHIPIVLLTAKDSLQDKTLGYAAGADSYITKPFTSQLLKNRIANILETRQRISEQITQHPPEKRSDYIEALSNRDNEFLKRVTDMIHEHIDSEKVDVVFLASQMNMSHSSFYRKVKALTGMTATEYIRKVKIRIAEEFLLTGKYTISEVTYAIGMNSITYFRECFKAEFGMSPSEYLKQKR